MAQLNHFSIALMVFDGNRHMHVCARINEDEVRNQNSNRFNSWIEGLIPRTGFNYTGVINFV